MSPLAGTASIDFEPDMTRLRAGVEAELNRLSHEKVKIGVDEKPAMVGLSSLGAQIQKVTGKRLELDTKEIDRQTLVIKKELAEIDAMRVDPEIDIDDESVNRRIAFLRANLKRLDAERISIKIDSSGVRSLDTSMTSVNQRFTYLRNVTRTLKLPALAGAAGAAAQGLEAAAGGVISLTSALAPATGAAVAYPALLGAIGQAAGVVALAGVNDLTEALGGNEEAFKRLTPQGQKFLKTLQGYSPEFDKIRSEVQADLFSGLEKGIKNADDNLPVLRTALAGTADELGHLADEAGTFLGRDGFGRDFGVIAKGNTDLIDDLGTAGFNFADALRHVLVVAQPFIHWMGDGIVTFSEFAESEAKAGRQSGEMAAFFRDSEDVIGDLVSIGGSLINVLGDLGHTSKPFGDEYLDDLRRGANELERITGSVQGQQDLEDFFQKSSDDLHEFTKALMDIADEGDVSDMLERAIELALPVVADHAREIGGALLEGTVKGFMTGNVWTQLFAAASIIRLIGGPGALRAVGATIGKQLFGGVAAEAATANIAASAVESTGAGEIYQAAGKQGGSRFAAAFGGAAKAGLIGGAVIGIQQAFTTQGGILDTIDGHATAWPAKLAEDVSDEFGTKLERGLTQGSTTALRASLRLFDRYSDQMKAAGEEIPDEIIQVNRKSQKALDSLQDKIGDVKGSFGSLQMNTYRNLTEIRKDTEDNLSKIESSLGTHSVAGRKLVERNFELAARAIEKSVDQGRIDAEDGFAEIHKLIYQKLKLYGLSDRDASKIATGSTKDPGDPGPGLARGGIAPVPGTGLYDTVGLSVNGRMAARVAPGEDLLVANRHQRPLLDYAVASAFGVNGLPGFFSTYDTPHYMSQGGELPGFAGGGINLVPVPASIPQYDSNLINAVVLPAAEAFASQFQLQLNDAYGPGHAALEHTEYGTAVDFGPVGGMSGNWADVDRAAAAAVKAGYTPVGYDGRFGTEAWPGHGPPPGGNHVHVTFLTAAEFLAGQKPGGASGAALSGAALKLNLPQFTATAPYFEPHAAGMNNLADGLERVISQRVAALAPVDTGMAGGTLGPGTPTDKPLPAALQKWNHTFPGAVLQNDLQAWANLTTMPFDTAAAIAEWAGLPGRTFAQVSMGEGGLKPGSMGDDNGDGVPDGFGWLAITRPFGDSYGVKELGGYEPGMLNPISNAIVAGRMYAAQGPGAWYGTSHVTDWNSHYEGPLLRALGGFLPSYAKGKGPKPHEGGISFDVDPNDPDDPINQANQNQFGPALPGLAELKRTMRKLTEINGDAGSIAKLDEKISIADTLAGLGTSPAGEDISVERDGAGNIVGGEALRLIHLNQDLLGALGTERDLAKRGLKLVKKALPTATGSSKTWLSTLEDTFESSLSDAVGVTGKGGRIFDVMQTLLDLGLTGTSTEPAETLSISDLSGIIEAARFGVYDAAVGIPTFHDGGRFAAPHGTNEGLALLRDDETVLDDDQLAGVAASGEFVATVPVDLGEGIERVFKVKMRRRDDRAALLERAGA